MVGPSTTIREREKERERERKKRGVKKHLCFLFGRMRGLGARRAAGAGCPKGCRSMYTPSHDAFSRCRFLMPSHEQLLDSGARLTSERQRQLLACVYLHSPTSDMEGLPRAATHKGNVHVRTAAGEYLPPVHILGATPAAHSKPAGQSTQTVAPLVENFPLAHVCGAALLDGQNLPASHSVHETAFASEYHPEAHVTIVLDRTSGQAVPATQAVQAVAPANAQVPAAHGVVGAAVAEGQAKPAGQMVHLVLEASAYSPALQATRAPVELVGSEQKPPAAQAVHEVDLATAKVPGQRAKQLKRD